MSAPAKKLVYVLNYVSVDDSQHFVHVLHLLRRLQQLGWEVVVLSEKGGRGEIELQGLPVRYLSRDGGALRLWRLAQALIGLRRAGFRLVFTRISRPAGLVAGGLGWLCGWRSLFWLSGAVLDHKGETPALIRAWRRFTLHLIARLSTRFVTGPDAMIAYYMRELGLARRRMLMLYNDIDTDRFRPAPRPPRAQVLRLLMVHRLSPVRETDRYFPALVAALNASRPVRLDIVGDGPERPALERLAAAAAPHVEIVFHGARPNAEIAAYYAQADLFLMPSYREGFPRVLIEAMACGLPVVATDAGGSAQLVGRRQSAHMVARDDAETFAAHVAALVADPQVRAALAAENRAHVQRFSTQAVARMYDAALSALLPGARA